ncbi:MAG: VOC family protein [Candidatus Binatia bacterium]
MMRSMGEACLPKGVPGACPDHVAIGVWKIADVTDFVVSGLRGRNHIGGPGLGFQGGQWSFINGGLLEIIEPRGSADGFLFRFLDRLGPGLHHITFKVSNLRAAADAVAAFGYDVVGYDDSHPGWKECFLHPKQAQGIVVQLAESHPHLDDDWGPNWDFPPAPEVVAEPVALLGLRMRARNGDAAKRQWAGLLGAGCREDGERRLRFEWEGSPMGVTVEVDPSRPDAALGIEIATRRPLDLPSNAHPSLGATFFVST